MSNVSLNAIAHADESERDALFSLALGRILRLGSRPAQPGDVAEYEEARAIIRTLAETAGIHPKDTRPNWGRDRLRALRLGLL